MNKKFTDSGEGNILFYKRRKSIGNIKIRWAMNLVTIFVAILRRMKISGEVRKGGLKLAIDVCPRSVTCLCSVRRRIKHLLKTKKVSVCRLFFNKRDQWFKDDATPDVERDEFY